MCCGAPGSGVHPGLPMCHGDGHASDAEDEYAVNFFQARFGTEPSHQAAADSGYITLGASWVVWHRMTGGGPPAPKKIIFSKRRIKGNPIFLSQTAGRKFRARAVPDDKVIK